MLQSAEHGVPTEAVQAGQSRGAAVAALGERHVLGPGGLTRVAGRLGRARDDHAAAVHDAGRPLTRQLLRIEHARERRRVERGEQRTAKRALAQHRHRHHDMRPAGQAAGDQIGDDGHAPSENRRDRGRVGRRRQLGAGGLKRVQPLAALGVDDGHAEPAGLPLQRAHGRGAEGGKVACIEQLRGREHLEGADRLVEGVIDRRADGASGCSESALGGVALAIGRQRQDDGREHEQGQDGHQHQRDEVRAQRHAHGV